MAGEAEIKAITEAGNSSAKVLFELIRLSRDLKRGGGLGRSENDNANLEPQTGAVRQQDLLAAARKEGDALLIQDGVPKKYLYALEDKAKNYGISFAVIDDNVNSNNVKISLRNSDKAIFEKILSETVKDEIAKNPNILSAFLIFPDAVSFR